MKVKLMDRDNAKTKTIDIKKLEQSIDKTLPMIRNNVILALNKQIENGIKSESFHGQKEYFQNAILLAELNERYSAEHIKQFVAETVTYIQLIYRNYGDKIDS